jgi:hypothetical protein
MDGQIILNSILLSVAAGFGLLAAHALRTSMQARDERRMAKIARGE